MIRWLLSRLPPGCLRTSSGSRIPLSRIDETSSSRFPMDERGCAGSGSISASATCLPIGVSLRAVSSSTKWWLWRILICCGRPLRRVAGSDTAEHLLGELVVLVGAAAARREGEDGLPVSRALLHADALADGRLEDLVPEDLANLAEDVARQQGALVVERDDGAEDLQLRV